MFSSLGLGCCLDPQYRVAKRIISGGFVKFRYFFNPLDHEGEKSYNIRAFLMVVDMSKDSAYQRLAMRIFADFSGTIAVPAVAGALLGVWLDRRYDTKPWFLIAMLVVAFGLTPFTVVKKAKNYSKEYDDLNRKV